MFKALRRAGLRPFALVALITVSGAHGAPASQCKTLSQEACGATPACAWVDGYTRKDGREVSAYCRKVPQRKASQSVGKRTVSSALDLSQQG
ncbi:MAG: hypothetical protein D6720_07885 [Gammaproteobacteria bacterium]|nr:MAG: hypothetical protein D6720_07885 [Gammaproteobacteria bacterium]